MTSFVIANNPKTYRPLSRFLRRPAPGGNPESGMVLLITIFLLMIMSLIGTAVLFSSTTELKIANNTNSNRKAFIIATSFGQVGVRLVELIEGAVTISGNDALFAGTSAYRLQIGDGATDNQARILRTEDRQSWLDNFTNYSTSYPFVIKDRPTDNSPGKTVGVIMAVTESGNGKEGNKIVAGASATAGGYGDAPAAKMRESYIINVVGLTDGSTAGNDDSGNVNKGGSAGDTTASKSYITFVYIRYI